MRFNVERKINIIFYAIFFFGVTGPQTWAASTSSKQELPRADYALTLMDCYRYALEQSEKIGIQAEKIKEAEAHFTQSFSTILPTVSYSYSDRRQNGSGGSAFTLREVPERKFVFSQPLFSGFKEFAAMAASQAERKQRKEEKRRAEQLLFTDVSDAFYLFLNYQDDYKVLRVIQNALSDRIAELNERVELGRSRISEVASVEARLRRIEADMERSLSEGEVARQLLEFLTGRPVQRVEEQWLAGAGPGDEEVYLAKADERPDVLAARSGWEAAKKQINIAQAGFLPAAALEGNYYQKRVGASAGVDWDATFRVDVPIFNGGRNVGDVREAKALEQQAKLFFEQTCRQAKLDIENTYTRRQAVLKRTSALEKAVAAAEKNYQLQQEDYQRSLVNNLEVLQALEDLEIMRRDLISVQTEARRLYWSLQVATGNISL